MSVSGVFGSLCLVSIAQPPILCTGYWLAPEGTIWGRIVAVVRVVIVESTRRVDDALVVSVGQISGTQPSVVERLAYHPHYGSS